MPSHHSRTWTPLLMATNRRGRTRTVGTHYLSARLLIVFASPLFTCSLALCSQMHCSDFSFLGYRRIWTHYCGSVIPVSWQTYTIAIAKPGNDFYAKIVKPCRARVNQFQAHTQTARTQTNETKKNLTKLEWNKAN